MARPRTGGKPALSQDEKIEAVARRVVELLTEILSTTNYGEIAIQVDQGAIEISGGPRHRIS